MVWIVLKVEYYGVFFVGWQCQVDQFLVQGVIEVVLVNFESGEYIIVVVGWMDVGVYGLVQVVYCDL